MDYDDKIREMNGLTICLRDMGNGNSRLFFDDVTADKIENPISWQFKYFYTFTPEFDNAEIDNMELSDDLYKQIGINVVARLLAMNGRIK